MTATTPNRCPPTSPRPVLSAVPAASTVAARCEPHGFPAAAKALGWALLIAAPLLGGGGWHVYTSRCEQRDALNRMVRAALAYEDLVGAPAQAPVPVDAAAHGRDLFTGACASCHGGDARGVEYMGKNLVTSDFVAATPDADLATFIAQGRVAKPLSMPPRGGHDELTDADLAHIVVYLRGVQDPRRMPALPAPVAAAVAPTEAQKASALAAAGGDAELAEFIASGDKLFHSTCVSCHGKGGAGIKGNGVALARNSFVQSLDNDGLLAFVKSGRGPSDPKNTSGIQMPPKGGNPALSDDDILDIIAYLRTLQPAQPIAGVGR